jgi:hypothetical protein
VLTASIARMLTVSKMLTISPVIDAVTSTLVWNDATGTVTVAAGAVQTHQSANYAAPGKSIDIAIKTGR